jgi:tryptophan 2,3-dioxygenase
MQPGSVMASRHAPSSSPPRSNAYADYLRLDELLQLQHPLSDAASATVERFFIVAHQASELWLKAVIEALEAAGEELGHELPHTDRALAHVRRAVAALEAFRSSLTALSALEVPEFLDFRQLLRGASGAQSGQFARLQAMVENPGSDSLETVFVAALRRDTGLGPADLLTERTPSVWLWLAHTMVDLSDALGQWRVEHLELASRLIGDRPGTGGSSGIGYLADRLDRRAFPVLRRALSGEAGDVGAGAERTRP